MARIPGKGTVLSIDIATVMTPVAQILSADISEAEPEMYEGRTLDQEGTGMEETPTGYFAGNEISGELFLNPALVGHTMLFDSDPFAHVDRDGFLTFADGSTYTFTANRISAGIKVAMNDGVKASFKIGLKEPGELIVAV